MTEKQLQEFKRILELRIELCEKDKSAYESKGEPLAFMVEKLDSQIDAYKIVLKDIERVMET
ncbi:TPA: hypothetical protein NJY08_005055 [Salmonella enterica subsp. enterica serovar Typhi str. AG3]|nr:hypothetical protein [Salmonella enterica subsp. enterica serovar Typhi str. AG3]